MSILIHYEDMVSFLRVSNGNMAVCGKGIWHPYTQIESTPLE